MSQKKTKKQRITDKLVRLMRTPKFKLHMLSVINNCIHKNKIDNDYSVYWNPNDPFSFQIAKMGSAKYFQNTLEINVQELQQKNNFGTLKNRDIVQLLDVMTKIISGDIQFEEQEKQDDKK